LSSEPSIPLAIAREQAHSGIAALRQEGVVVSIDHFRRELRAQMGRASAQGSVDIVMTSGELYRSLGGYPGSSHGMTFCCDAMQDEMKPGDILLVGQVNGVGMTVRYYLPR
jgi:hypothetical protein